MIEDILESLFDYQRFAHNAHLDQLINQDRQDSFCLSDSELEQISAAGSLEYIYLSQNTTPDL